MTSTPPSTPPGHPPTTTGSTTAERSVAAPHAEQRAGIIAGFTAYFVWGLLTIFWKQLHHFDAFELIGWRITASAIVMAVVLSLRHEWGDLRVLLTNRGLLARVAAAAVLLTVNWTSYVWAVVHGHVLETALGYFIAPLGTVALGVIVLKENLRAAQVFALVMAVASVVVLTISYGRVPWLALAIAVSWTAYGYIKKHLPLTPVESMAAESFILVIPAAALAIALAGRAGSIPNSASHAELTYAVLTGLATVLPLTMFAYAAQRVPLTLIGPMQYIVPSMNFVIGWLMYDEAMPAVRFLGFALVWIGLLVFTTDSVIRLRRASSAVAT